MELRSFFGLLNNPLEDGIWQLTINMPDNLSSIKHFLPPKTDEFFFRERVFYIFLKLLEQNSKTFTKYGELVKTLKNNLKLIRADEDKVNEYSRFSFFEKEVVIDYENYQDYLAILKPLNHFVQISPKPYDLQIDFLSLEKEQFFKIIPKGLLFKEIRILSYEKENLTPFLSFFEKISKDIKLKLEKKYYPDRLVFLNYPFLFYNQKILNILKENIDARKNLYLALEEFSAGKIDASIRFLGILMEEILTEIYEMCIRERIPENMTLNNLLQGINSEINSIIGRVGSIDRLEIDSCLSLLNKPEMKKQNNHSIRKILLYNLRLSQKINKDIEQINKHLRINSSKNMFFPEKVYEYLNLAIKFRNISSHKNNQELSDFESSLTFRGTFSLFLWWEYIKRKILDWDVSKEEIILKIIEESKTYPNILEIISVFS